MKLDTLDLISLARERRHRQLAANRIFLVSLMQQLARMEQSPVRDPQFQSFVNQAVLDMSKAVGWLDTTLKEEG